MNFITFIIPYVMIAVGSFGLGYFFRALTSGPRVGIYRSPRRSR